MSRSIVRLPQDIDHEDFEVYLNGVLQAPDSDYYVDRRELIFDRPLRTDRISVWRWLVGAFGVGTYRPHDTVDIPLRGRRRDTRQARVVDHDRRRLVAS